MANRNCKTINDFTKFGKIVDNAKFLSKNLIMQNFKIKILMKITKKKITNLNQIIYKI